MATRHASELVDRIEQSEADVFDLWPAFAVPLVSRVACHVVGIPERDADRVGKWAIDLVNAFFVMDAAMRERAEGAAVEFLDYLDDHLARLRADPGDDVASMLIVAQDSDSGISHDLTDLEIRALVANLVFGGLEATAKVITTGVFHLLVEQQWDVLVERPEMVPSAVPELLRFAPPVGTARLAGTDLVARGVAMSAGQMALLDPMGACRDPARHHEPDSLDVDREPGRQLAFGAGAHYCLGANLATVVLEEALGTLVRRFPRLHLAVDAQDVTWDHETFTGIVGMEVARG